MKNSSQKIFINLILKFIAPKILAVVLWYLRV